MPSVIASWSGRIAEREARLPLLAYLQELAERNKAKWDGTPVPRPAFLEAVSAQRGSEDIPASENSQSFDHSITGRILLSPGICDAEHLSSALRQRSQSMAGDALWSIDPGATSLAFYSTELQQNITVPYAGVRLHGIAFRLYDPRQLYPDEDRLSFVFIDMPEFPELHGRMVNVYDRRQCQLFTGKLIDKADYYLAEPSIHLRYYLEDWYDLLMVWIKQFFLPDLTYRRHEEMSQFEEIKTMMDRLIESAGTEFAKQTIFEYLLERFEYEAEEWSDTIGSMAVELGTKVDSHSRLTLAEPLSTSKTVDDSKIERLYAKLYSKVEGRARSAMEEICDCGPAALPWIERALNEPQLKDQHWDWLDRIRDLGPPALPLFDSVVEKLLADGASTATQIFAARALAAMGSSADFRIQELLQSGNPDHRLIVRDFVLTNFTSDRIGAFLIELLRHRNGDLRLQACEYLALEIHPQGDPVLMLNPSDLIPHLVSQVAIAPEDMHQAIVDALCGLGVEGIAALQSLLSSPDKKLELAGLDGLLRILETGRAYLLLDTNTPKSILQKFTDRLEHPCAAIRVAAAVGLQRWGDYLASCLLGVEIKNVDRGVAIRAAKGVAKIAHASTEQAKLQESLNVRVVDENLDVISARRLAAAHLSATREPRPSTLLRLSRGLTDWEDPWRFEYLEAIEKAGQHSTLRLIIPKLLVATAAEPRLQILALKILANIQADPNLVLERMLVCLQSKVVSVRLAAATVLARLGPSPIEACVGLAEALLDRNDEVARVACQALGNQAKVAAVFVPNILDTASRFEVTAINALANINTAESRAAVKGLFCELHENESRRQAYRWLDEWKMITDESPPPEDDPSDEDDA